MKNSKTRKVFLAAAMLLVASLAQAKHYHIVIRGTGPIRIGPKTEVFVGDKQNQSDTITVIPAANITEIQLTVKNFDGEEILSEVIPVAYPTNVPEAFYLITPELPEGFLLEVKDNNGVVYTGVEDDD